MSFHPFRRRVVVFEGLGRPRVGQEADARSRLYPSTRRLVSVLAGGAGYEKSDGRGGENTRPSDPKEK
jgi:hypothetical protein